MFDVQYWSIFNRGLHEPRQLTPIPEGWRAGGQFQDSDFGFDQIRYLLLEFCKPELATSDPILITLGPQCRMKLWELCYEDCHGTLLN